ncbi:hypothetical protein [Azospirillum melinis]|uniref:hypothetical protein n=1 Tax=Azospirillum melinis TaxID=328839 RepID=UPI00157A3EC6|nr:hypothetical protein [Azospirillum melinis]MBP2307483.1 hypothetical protein [Azospirillum melinis]
MRGLTGNALLQVGQCLGQAVQRSVRDGLSAAQRPAGVEPDAQAVHSEKTGVHWMVRLDTALAA